MPSATIDTSELDGKIAELTEALGRQSANVSTLTDQARDARAAHASALQAVDLHAAAAHLEETSDLDDELARAQAVADSYRSTLADLTRQRQAADYAAQRDALTAQIGDAARSASALLDEVRTAFAALPAKLAHARGIEQHRAQLEAERHTVRQALGETDAAGEPIPGFSFLTVDLPVKHAVAENPLLAAIERGFL